MFRISIFAFAVITAVPAAALAQSNCIVGDSASQVTDTAGIKPSVVLRATVRARTLRFDANPQQQLQLLGCPTQDRLFVRTRTNLPQPVQPGTTYNNVTISIEIRSYYLCVALLEQLRSVCASMDSTATKRRGM